MQFLTTYLLEFTAESPSAAADRASAIRTEVDGWLSSKGVKNPSAPRGRFDSLSRSKEGAYARTTTTGDRGTLVESRLEEFAAGDQIFTTTLFEIHVDSSIKVYLTLTTTSVKTVLMPVFQDSRCPTIIRTLLKQFPDWTLGGHIIGEATPRVLAGAAGASVLAALLRDHVRTIPIVVVSDLDGEPIWPTLPKNLAYDLAGLAHVISIDDEASFALWDEIGKLHSCYRGAVRLYWPARVHGSEVILPSTVWTASQLLSTDHEGEGLQKFRAVVRRSVMSVAASNFEPPHQIREIQNYPARKRLKELEQKATSSSAELEIARSYLEDNERLKADLEAAARELASFRARAEMAEYALAQNESRKDQGEQSSQTDDESPPQPGQVLFYKKTHSAPGHDVLVRVTDCGHRAWQSAKKADKARKGLARLERRDDWKSLHHCGICTGGGMWKVEW